MDAQAVCDVGVKRVPTGQRVEQQGDLPCLCVPRGQEAYEANPAKTLGPAHKESI